MNKNKTAVAFATLFLLLTEPWGMQAQGVRTSQADQVICCLICQLALAVAMIMRHSMQMQTAIDERAAMSA